jgi:adenine-specific DNA-methyltransferase
MPTLDFKGKSVIETYHHSVPHHTLEFDPKLSLLPKGQKPSLDGNLIIEGDNLLALKALLPTHAGKIKCIYIDPPYNTGNEGWVYNDNLTQPQFKEWIGQTVGKEGEDATRHDKWCCMMYPRLQILRELLSDDGCIWVSIDDNESSNLRQIMDEVFGRDCFAAQVTVLNNRKGRGLRGGFAQSHDYLLAYTKRPEGTTFETLKSAKQIEREYTLIDAQGRYRELELRNTHREFGAHNRKNLFYPLYISTTDGTVATSPQTGRKKVEPIWDDGFKGCWSWKVAKCDANLDQLVAKEVDGRWKVYRKARPTPRKPKTVWHKKSYLTERGQKLLTAMFGKRVFHAPKPLDLIIEVLRFGSSDGDTILDACAGSGTTGHAVLALNAESETPRKFILVQQPQDNKADIENDANICENVTLPRVMKAIQGYKSPKGTDVAGLPGSFTYAHLGPALFNEYRHLGDKLPSFKEIAKYVFYTETSHECDLAKINEAAGFIGSTALNGGTSYYLFYTPNGKEDRELSAATLADLAKKDKNKNWVIYCERIWLHADQLRKFKREHHINIRPMLVPFNLK